MGSKRGDEHKRPRSLGEGTGSKAPDYSEAPQRATASRLVPTHQQDHRAIKRRCAPMLGLKSFATAAVTLSGIELAHRIRKRQFTIPYERDGGALSLKELSIPARHSRLPGPRTRRGVVRYTRKFSFGHSLYLLVTPKGGRYWRYRYRFQGRERILALGCYPEVPTKSARARHRAARRLLALGIDPADRRKTLRQISAELVSNRVTKTG